MKNQRKALAVALGDIGPAQVTEPTIYPEDFPIFLRCLYPDRTVDQVASILGTSPEHAQRLLEGQWRPSKEIRRRMGIKTVYALPTPAPKL